MRKSQKTTRRSFLKKSAVLAGLPTIITSQVSATARRPSPSERITVGVIGSGKRGHTLMRGLQRFGEIQFVAIAEVEANRRSSAKKLAEDHHARQKDKGNFKGVETYGDFRQLLPRMSVDSALRCYGIQGGKLIILLLVRFQCLKKQKNAWKMRRCSD